MINNLLSLFNAHFDGEIIKKGVLARTIKFVKIYTT